MRTPAQLLAAHGIKLPSTEPGRHYTTCPRCSHKRSKAHQVAKVLGVTIKADGKVHFGCNHCGWTGPEKQSGNGHDREREDIEAAYDYIGFQKVRYRKGHEPRFRLRHLDKGGDWRWGSGGANTDVLYRRDEIEEAIANDRIILVVEGEKDVDNAWRIGMLATCNSGGASEPDKKPKWKREHSEQLRGADIVVIPDHDAAGYAHAEATCRLSVGIAKRVRKLVLAEHWPNVPKGGDVSDWLDAGHTREELDTLIEQAPDYAPGTTSEPGDDARVNGGQGPSLALPLTYFDDLSDNPAQKPWVTKNVLARGELSSWIAPPGKGKSSLLVEIAIHAAAPKDWRGYRVKQRTGVVIFAFERADLTKRRLVAHRRRDGLRDLPIAVTGKIINLLAPTCADIMLATIREAEEHMRCEVGLIIVDTFAKGIAAGDGDEDKARDQNKVHANLRRLFDLGCNVHIAGVGHTGKDESRGERGSNARLADVDLQVQIGGDVIKTVNVTKANDQPEGVLTMFKLEPFDFEPDEDGNPFQVAIVSADIIPTGGQQGSKRQKPTDRQTLALRALAEVVLSRGQDPPPSYQLPLGIKVVTLRDWEEELYRSNVLDRDGSNVRARFKELRESLASRFLIGMRDIWVWSAARPV
jgi:hypothetical protein